MCLGQWSILDLIDEEDLDKVSHLPEIEGENSDDETNVEYGSDLDDN